MKEIPFFVRDQHDGLDLYGANSLLPFTKHGQPMIIYDGCFVRNQHSELVLYGANSLSLRSDKLSMLSWETANTNVIVLSLK